MLVSVLEGKKKNIQKQVGMSQSVFDVIHEKWCDVVRLARKKSKLDNIK
jgi:hypothetical protein